MNTGGQPSAPQAGYEIAGGIERMLFSCNSLEARLQEVFDAFARVNTQPTDHCIKSSPCRDRKNLDTLFNRIFNIFGGSSRAFEGIVVWEDAMRN